MIAGGASVKGHHTINQDCYLCLISGDDAVVAVSDGLGSLPYSHFGSEALCSCIHDIFAKKLDVTCKDHLGKVIQQMWLERLRDKNADECCATALVCFVRRNVITAAAVGDGYLCAIADGKPLVLVDAKEGCFRNETQCLHSGSMDEDWRIVHREFQHLEGVYLSSDGIALADESAEGISAFVQDFVNCYRGKTAEEINSEMTEWISRWTGNDDKTAAYIIG